MDLWAGGASHKQFHLEVAYWLLSKVSFRAPFPLSSNQKLTVVAKFGQHVIRPREALSGASPKDRMGWEEREKATRGYEWWTSCLVRVLCPPSVFEGQFSTQNPS